MPDTLSRRRFLHSAGGVTFLALTPTGRGLFAATFGNDTPPTAAAGLPLFLALPYLQPGDNSRLTDGAESQIVAWQTDRTPGAFTLEYGTSPRLGKTATIVRKERAAGSLPDATPGYSYTATLGGLALATKYHYRLTAAAIAPNGKKTTLAEGYFATRKKRGTAIRFVAFGDNANGSAGERAIAYHAYKANPDFIMNTGDNVYSAGLNHEYLQNFFPVYNAVEADSKVGAPLLRSVPFYSVMANHDVTHRDADHHSVADFDKAPDALGYYSNLHLPLNGPTGLLTPTRIIGAEANRQAFQQLAGPRFPRMANYSFEVGDVHFCCLDSNVYVDPTDPTLQAWIAADLSATNAPWKFVVYHHPAFNAGNNHYNEQQMRILSPLFEKHGVDFCLSGHEHTYQRTMPLRFVPDPHDGSPVGGRRVPGTFTVDTTFDGKKNTKPNGILYITTGAGGAGLYDPGFDDAPEKWRHPEDKSVAYVSRFVSSQHSFTVFDVTATELTMTQIGERGDTLDTIRVVK